MLGTISSFERDIMLERQREGIAIAKQKGLYKRKPSRFSDEDVKQIKKEFGETKNKAKLARKYKISRTYLYKMVK